MASSDLCFGVLAVLLLSGCSNSGTVEDATEASAPDTVSFSVVDERPTFDEVEELVPDGVDLVFVAETLDLVDDSERQVEALVPEGWILGRPTKFQVQYEAPTTSRQSSILFAEVCDFTCGPKDWASSLNGVNGQLDKLREPLVVRRNEALGDGWILLGTNQGIQKGWIFRWDDSVEQAFACRVLVGKDRDPREFEALTAACLAAKPTWIG